MDATNTDDFRKNLLTKFNATDGLLGEESTFNPQNPQHLKQLYDRDSTYQTQRNILILLGYNEEDANKYGIAMANRCEELWNMCYAND